jgi:putative SOS response-associated peptidase YedK
LQTDPSHGGNKRGLFAFARLYDVWQDPKTGKETYSYTIITTAANGIVGKIHERMPIILLKEDEVEWLNPDNSEPEQLLPLLKQYPDAEMEAYFQFLVPWVFLNKEYPNQTM